MKLKNDDLKYYCKKPYRPPQSAPPNPPPVTL